MLGVTANKRTCTFRSETLSPNRVKCILHPVCSSPSLSVAQNDISDFLVPFAESASEIASVLSLWRSETELFFHMRSIMQLNLSLYVAVKMGGRSEFGCFLHWRPSKQRFHMMRINAWKISCLSSTTNPGMVITDIPQQCWAVDQDCYMLIQTTQTSWQ